MSNTVEEAPRIAAGVNLLSRDHFIMRPQLRIDSAATRSPSADSKIPGRPHVAASGCPIELLS
jgi:hypothetical protein